MDVDTFAVFREALLAPEICPRSLARTVEESVAQDKRSSGSIQNKQIHIEWKVGNDKSKRLVKVGDDIAFQQSGDDLSGSFSAAFSHLSLE